MELWSLWKADDPRLANPINLFDLENPLNPTNKFHFENDFNFINSKGVNPI